MIKRFGSSVFLVVLILSFSNLSAETQPVSAKGGVPGASGPASPATLEYLWVTPLEFDFGPVGISNNVAGSSGPVLTATITNKSSYPLTGLSGGNVPAPFYVTQDCDVPGGILPGQHCHYFFTFHPSTSGSFSATSSTITNLGSFQIMLHGSGVDGLAVPNSTSLDFGSVFTGISNPLEQVVTIRNAGLAPLTQFAGGAISDPFNAIQDCVIAGGVLPGKSCHYFITFKPSASGVFSATSSSIINGTAVNIDVKGIGRTINILTGAGQHATPLGLDFGPVGVGQASEVLTTTLHNESSLTGINSITAGAVPAPFNLSQDCGPTLGPFGSCHFVYTFSPSTAGDFTAISTITDNEGTFSVQLHGTGIAPSLTASPLALDFGPQPVGSIQPQQVVTVTNTSLSPITGWTGGNVPAPFSSSEDCSQIQGGLPPGSSCHFYYGFSPTDQVSSNTTSNVTTNGGSFHILLEGQGAPPLHFSFIPLAVK